MNALSRGLVSVVALAAVAACATTQPPPTLQTGPDAEVTPDGLVRIDHSRVPIAYMKPDVDLGPYTRIMVDPVDVAYKKDPGNRRTGGMGEDNFALSPRQMDDFRQEFQDAVTKALSRDGGYEITTEPGPDVLRVSASLIDLIVRVPTERMGRESIATRSYGEVSLIIELRDSQSGEILVRAADRRDPTRNTSMNLASVTSVSVRADVRQMFEHWANLLRQRLDEVRAG